MEQTRTVRTPGDKKEKYPFSDMDRLEAFANEASRRHMTYGQLQALETLGLYTEPKSTGKKKKEPKTLEELLKETPAIPEVHVNEEEWLKQGRD